MKINCSNIKPLLRLIPLATCLFSSQLFADIVHFDNSKCGRNLLYPQAVNTHGKVAGPNVIKPGEKDIQLDTGNHFQKNEAFDAGFDGLLTSGQRCRFVANGGHHFIRTETNIFNCIVKQCEG